MAATLPEILSALQVLRRADAEDVDAAVGALGATGAGEVRALAADLAEGAQDRDLLVSMEAAYFALHALLKIVNRHRPPQAAPHNRDEAGDFYVKTLGITPKTIHALSDYLHEQDGDDA